MELAEIGISKPEEPGAKIEKGASRETVIKAFNFLNDRIEKIPDDPSRPEIAWIKKSIKDAHDKTDLENGKDTFTSSFENHHTGETFTQEEGIPTELLLQLISEEIKKVEKTDREEWKLLRKYARVIYRSSKKFREIPHRLEPSQYEGRLHQEALWISEDPNRRTGTEVGDWDMAQDLLNNRLELTLPKKPSRTSTPRGTTTPGAAAGTAPATGAGGTTSPDSESDTSAGSTGPDTGASADTETAIPEDGNENQVQPQSVEQIRREFVIANRSVDIRKRAQELAELQLREEQRRGSVFNPLNWARKAKFRIMEEYYRQQYIERATDAMIDNNNSYLTMDLVKNAAVNATNKIAEERQAGQAKVEEIKIQTAEGITLEGTTIKEAQGELKDALMRDIIRPIVTGENSPLLEGKIENYDDVQEALEIFMEENQGNADIAALFGTDASKYKQLANYFASDLLEMGQQVKDDIGANVYAVDQLNEIVKIQLANTNWAAETETTFNLTDKAVRWAESHRLTGVLINPATIGAAASIGMYGAMRVAGIGGIAMQATVPLAGLLPGAFFAGIRRNYDLKIDRAAHQVERAYNKQIPQNEAPRRQALEKFAYNTASVDELLNGGGQELLTGNLRRGVRELLALDLSEEQVSNREEVARRIMEIRTRLDFSAQQHADLITFASREQWQQGRTELVKAIAAAKKALIGKGMTEEEINSFGAKWNEKFIQNKEQQDKAFAGYKLRESLKAGAFGGAVGLAAGLVTQEVGAELGREVLHQNVGQTAIEKGLAALGLHLGEQPGAGGMGKEVLQQLYEHPGNLRINDNLTLAVNGQDPLRSAGFLDGASNRIEGPPMHLSSDGKLIISGTYDNLPEPFKGIAHANVDTNYNIHKDIQDMITPGKERSGVFQHGNTIVSVDGANKAFSMQDFPSKTEIYGTINSDGSFNIDPYNPANKGVDWNIMQDRLQTEGWDIKQENLPGIPRKETFTEYSTNVDHREGYSYNQPGSQENELRLHNSKAGNTVTLDISHMKLGYQSSLNPNPIDVQQVVNNHEAGWYFTLPDSPQDGIWVTDGADGIWDGKLLLNPNDIDPTHIIQTSKGPLQLGEFSKMVLNQDALQKYPDGNLGTEFYSRQDVFNLGQDGKYGFIEAGRVINKDGVNVLQHFATIRGLSDTPTPTNIIHLVPPDATEFDFPSAAEAPPIIPIPFAPRHPLERLITIGYGGGYEGGDSGLLPWSEFPNRRSRTLLQNPDAQLDERMEIQTYLDGQPAEYRSELENMNSQLGNPMSENCRVTFAIPALEEGANIRKTLEQFLNQKDKDGHPLNPNLFEIIIIENHPSTMEKDNTEEEIRAFKQAHPQINVYYTHKVWKPGEGGVGRARKYVNDLALLRSFKRTKQDGELILISNDADLDGISANYIESIISEFDTKKELDALAGKWTLPESTLNKPNVRAAERLWYFLDRVIQKDAIGDPNQRSLRTPGLVGRNAAFRASMYAAIGGYNPDAKIAEDLEIGWMINEARGWNPKRMEFLNRASVISNPRRFLAATVQRVPLIQMYGGFHENMEVRKLNNEELLKQIPDTFDLKRFEMEADAIWQSDQYKKHFPEDKLKLMLDRAMGFIGAEYKLEEKKDDDGVTRSHVIITNVDRLLKGLGSHSGARRNQILPQANTSNSLSQPTPNVLQRFEGQVNNFADLLDRTVDVSQAQLTTLASQYRQATQGLVQSGMQRSNATLVKLGDRLSDLAQQSVTAAGDKKTAVVANFKQTLEQVRVEVQRLSSEDLRQLGARIDTLSHRLGTTLGANRERIVTDLIPLLNQYVDSSKAALGTGIAGINAGNRLAQLEGKLKSLTAQAQTSAGKGSLALYAEIQKTINQYQQQVQAILAKRRQPAPVQPPVTPPATPEATATQAPAAERQIIDSGTNYQNDAATFWQALPEDQKTHLEELMDGWLQTDIEDGRTTTFLNIKPEDLDGEDKLNDHGKAFLAAYRQRADLQGLKLGNFEFDPQTKRASASIFPRGSAPTTAAPTEPIVSTPAVPEIMTPEVASTAEFTDMQKEALETQKAKIKDILQRLNYLTPDKFDEVDQIFSLITDHWSEINVPLSEEAKKLAISISGRLKKTPDINIIADPMANLFSNPEIQSKYSDLNDYFNRKPLSSSDSAKTVERQIAEFVYSLKAIMSTASSKL